jgi:hypothetical protein
MYAANGEHVTARDVLDDDEYADYLRDRRTRGGRMRTVPVLTEEQALAAYERLVSA